MAQDAARTRSAGAFQPAAWLAGGGDLAALIASIDWSPSALGPLGVGRKASARR